MLFRGAGCLDLFRHVLFCGIMGGQIEKGLYGFEYSWLRRSACDNGQGPRKFFAQNFPHVPPTSQPTLCIMSSGILPVLRLQDDLFYRETTHLKGNVR